MMQFLLPLIFILSFTIIGLAIDFYDTKPKLKAVLYFAFAAFVWFTSMALAPKCPDLVPCTTAPADSVAPTTPAQPLPPTPAASPSPTP